MRFASDNAGPVHPKVMEALAMANEGWALPYGNDGSTRQAVDKVRDVFDAPDAAVYFVATGSAANAILLGTMTAPFQTVFCTAQAHIHEDECNAPEFYTGGAKLTLVASDDARMSPQALETAITAQEGGNVHGPQPGPVSVTQVTERGTVYTLDQLGALAQVAKAHELPVHLDGARFANALVALGTTPADMTWRLGIDAVSFGGTKNGLMGVEAAVIFDPEKAWEFELRRKRGGHLFSKNRFLAAQMDAYLTDNLWLDMAERANAAAAKLVAGFSDCPEVRLLHPSEANMIYVEMPRRLHRQLHEAGAVYYLQGTLEGADEERLSARLVADWSCPDGHIETFLKLCR